MIVVTVLGRCQLLLRYGIQMLATTPLIDFRKVTVRRSGRSVLEEFSLCIPEGQHLAILGPNGCGKSTFIKAITRELYPDPEVPDSYLEIFGRRIWNIFDLRPLLGIVSYDWLDTCRRNDYPCREIILSGFFSSVGIWPHHEVTPDMHRRTDEVMDLLEIAHLADRPICEISSGEGRRVLIARALVHRPKAMILDEPANSLDLGSMHQLRSTLRRVAGQGTSLLLVTHHLADIVPEIERVVLMRDGRVFFDGPKSAALDSATLSALYQTEVTVDQRDGYFHAW
jgi:iron complex transport system ATP-binding protein